MYKYLENNFKPYKKPINNGSIKCLGLQRMKKRLQNLYAYFHDKNPAETQALNQ